MIQNNELDKCCGCGVCKIVCPQKCIMFYEDILGNRIARVDTSFCINCGACEKVCPTRNNTNEYGIGLKAYAAYSINNSVRNRGSSGGLFETFASMIIANNGCVFASKFDNNLKLKMFEANSNEEVAELTKSKYLLSDSYSIFPNIKRKIIEGKMVLVCSTPCQISALKKYLGNYSNYDNLYLIDFFCHGVPSQSFFDRCMKYTEKKKNIKIINFEFRTKKKNGSTPHYFTLTYNKKNKIRKKTSMYFENPFYSAFQKYIILRDSCYNCKFGFGNHESDIVIGDFHNIESYIKGINRFDGVSTLIINSKKGFEMLKKVEDYLKLYEVDAKKLYNENQIFSGSTPKPDNRDAFLNDIKLYDFDNVIEKWFVKRFDFKKNIYYRSPKIIRRIVKKVMKV